MRRARVLNRTRSVKPTLALLAIVLSTCVAHAQPSGFVEEFSGASYDPNEWIFSGDPNGHPATIAGTYDISDAHGAPGVKLLRNTSGTLSSFTHEIELTLNPFLLSGSGGTQSDFKFKSFGADGFLELVVNSFGAMRLFHLNSSDPNNVQLGDLQPNTNIGYSDGDTLKLTTDYDQGTDTVDVSYSLNGGSAIPFYTGTGNGGSLGDLVTSLVEVELFKWGSDEPTQAVASIDKWSLVPDAIPGDFNSDGSVDGLDFLLWQQNPSVGSLNDWETNYGAEPLLASISSVPEPNCILMLLLSTVFLSLSRRSGRTT